MICFPIVQRLDVDGYGMYPGAPPGVGLKIEFQPGLTLVIGANGLGKTTLVTMMFRLCTGPSDIPGLARGSELGSRNIQATELSSPSRRIFAARVTDGAHGATAKLRFALGDHEFEVSRSLENLRLSNLIVDGEEQPVSEQHFQDLVLEYSRLTSFGDWILVLRHLVFYFEDRRALVWDASAQRQILRLLFLPADAAREWTDLERDILVRDSRMRNLQAALSREEISVRQVERSVGSSGEIREHLQVLQDLQAIDAPLLEELNTEISARDADRQNARLARLRAEVDQEYASRNLERLQLQAIHGAFPTDDDTAKYLFAKLFADDRCLACGHAAPATAEQLKQRLVDHRCVVCGSALGESETVKPIAPRSIRAAEKQLRKAEELLTTCVAEADQVESQFSALITAVQELNTRVANRDAEIDSLVKRLPPADADLIKQREDLAMLRGRVESQKSDLENLRATFASFISEVNREIVRQKDAVQTKFATYASGFLLERCSLLWATHKSRVGESGQQIDFPSFELELAGADFPSPVLRSGPEQVSESQREFIDLAFRMTLMAVAGYDDQGTLVIDAPESSLDAVFVGRAAAVLDAFSRSEAGNRLVVTSNLIEGDLIPAMLRNAGIRSPRDARVVDLLDLAAPTAATHQLGSAYKAVRTQLFRRAREAQ